MPVTAFRTGDPVDSVWRGAMAVSAFLAVLVLYIFPAIAHEYDARLARDAARMPVEVALQEATGDTGDVIGFWGAREDQVADREVTVEFFLPVGDPSQAPPGVPSWPGPGEVFASPELLDTPGGTELVARYGTLVGRIAPRILTDRSERTLYVGVDPQLLDPPSYWGPVTGFGVGVDPARGDAGMLGSTMYQSPRSSAFLLAAVFGLAPLLVLVVTLARLGGDRRDSTVDLLVALGASRRQISAALWYTARVPLAAGSLIAAVLVYVLNHTSWTVPYTGYVMTPSPDTGQALALAASWCAGGLLTWAALWIGVRPRRVRFGSTRPASPPRMSTRWPVLGILASLLVVNWLYTLVNVANPTFAAVVLFSGVLVCIVLLGPATATLLTAVARGIVASARRHSRPTTYLVGRELSAMARSAVRATVFMGVVALTATFATVIATLPHEVLRMALGASTLNAGRSVSIQTGASAHWLPELGASLPDNEHLLQLTKGLGARDGRLTAPCRTQEVLLGACAGQNPTPLGTLTEVLPAPLRAWGLSPRTIVATGEVAAGQVLVLTDDEVRVDTAGLGGLLRELVSPVPRISEPGAEWIVGAGVGVRQARWIVVAGAMACVFAVTMGCATLLAEVVRIRRRHRLFIIHAGGFRRHLALGVGLVGLPLVLGAVLGGLTGALATYSAVRLGNASAASAGATSIALVVVAAAAAGVASVATALSTSSAARGHRPG